MSVRDVIPERLKRSHADLRHRLRWRRSPIARMTRAFVAHHGLTVQAGPFAGMTYPGFAVERGELVVAQLLGSYEREIAGAIQRAVDRRFEQYIDIGASDGYYAVGFARSCPSSVVYAYEMNPFPARVCRELAIANAVEGRLHLRGECRVEDLAALPERPSFVLCDTEGAEASLMDPDAVPLLRSATLIVELHAFAVPDIEQTVSERFARTHHIDVMRTQPRYTGEFPALMEVPGVSYLDRQLAVAEFRPYPMAWAVMEPRERS
jgi:predicted O-methyltransferase YrrM